MEATTATVTMVKDPMHLGVAAARIKGATTRGMTQATTEGVALFSATIAAPILEAPILSRKRYALDWVKGQRWAARSICAWRVTIHEKSLVLKLASAAGALPGNQDLQSFPWLAQILTGEAAELRQLVLHLSIDSLLATFDEYLCN